jgi:SAM-dependent methyltransferase
MSDVRKDFYVRNIRKYFVGKDPTVLVCGAGPFDKSVFEAAGFRNVTISNLDSRMKGNEYDPYQWSYQNGEAMTFADDSFDYVAIHAAIHHASSPHRLLTEMYRVARKGVFAIESRDSFTMRLFERLGLTQVYEHAAVYYNDFKYGGVNNTHIPNYVYRWTEREIEKTIKSYAPHARQQFFYEYATAFPVSSQVEKGAYWKYILLRVAQPFFWILTKIFRRQQNLFAFFISKPSLPKDLFPWLTLNSSKQIVFNEEWGHAKYKHGKPKINS